jgi:hypothetical protein
VLDQISFEKDEPTIRTFSGVRLPPKAEPSFARRSITPEREEDRTRMHAIAKAKPAFQSGLVRAPVDCHYSFSGISGGV